MRNRIFLWNFLDQKKQESRLIVNQYQLERALCSNNYLYLKNFVIQCSDCSQFCKVLDEQNFEKLAKFVFCKKNKINNKKFLLYFLNECYDNRPMFTIKNLRKIKKLQKHFMTFKRINKVQKNRNFQQEDYTFFKKQIKKWIKEFQQNVNENYEKNFKKTEFFIKDELSSKEKYQDQMLLQEVNCILKEFDN